MTDMAFRLSFASFFTLCLAALTAPTHAQERSPLRGLVVAQKLCAVCHAIGGDEDSPNIDAPAFEAIAAVSGLTAAALQASLQTSHKTMPNLILQAGDRANLVAYILSLQPK
jgi:mono/diheme cytochrome c family protein